MEGQERLIYGWDGAEWAKVLVDAEGHLQVDVVTGGATESHCYGWTGAAWTQLLVETLANANLRVRLYAADEAITALAPNISAYNPVGKRALLVLGTYALYYSVTAYKIMSSAFAVADNSAGSSSLPVCLWGYDGTNWDRLRTYGIGILKVGRAEIGLLTVRMVAVGQVGAAGARKLYWLDCNPSAGNSVWALSDDIDGSTAIVLDEFHTSKESHLNTYDPPMEFANGIYLKTFTNMTSVTFGYL